MVAANATVAQGKAKLDAATKARTTAQQAEAAAQAKLAPVLAAHTRAAQLATARQQSAATAKAHWTELLNAQQKPAQAALAAAETILKELTPAKKSSALVLTRLKAEMLVAQKPVDAAKAVAAKAQIAAPPPRPR